MANYYYSGQGSLYAATRNALTGKAEGFVAMGNVPELTLDIEIDKFEHKESESGARLLDLTIVKTKKGKFKLKLENLTLDNLALGLYGVSSIVAGAPVVSEPLTAFSGKRCPLANARISAVTVTAPNATPAARVNSNPYTVGQYYVPAVANSHYYKCTILGTSAAAPPAFTTNGTTFADGTATFKDMGLVTKTLTSDYTLDLVNGVLIPVVGGGITDGEPLAVSYTYAGYNNMEAFTTSASPERWLRFEGLNTVDDTKVLLDLYRAQFDPLTGYSLLSDEIASVDLGGNLLADSFIVGGGLSQFFRQRNLV